MLYGMIDFLNMVDVTVNFKVPERQLRRNNKAKDRYPQKGTSCFRKGYHKYEKEWKNSERRKNRRNNKVGDVELIPDYEAIKNWGEVKNLDFIKNGVNTFVYDSYHVDAFPVDETGNYVEWENPDCIGVRVEVLWEGVIEEEPWWLNDDDLFYEAGNDDYFLSKDKIVKMGLVTVRG